jgi:hypothetical protein
MDNISIRLMDVSLVLDLARIANQLRSVSLALFLGIQPTHKDNAPPIVEMESLLDQNHAILEAHTQLDALDAKFSPDGPAQASHQFALLPLHLQLLPPQLLQQPQVHQDQLVQLVQLVQVQPPLSPQLQLPVLFTRVEQPTSIQTMSSSP